MIGRTSTKRSRWYLVPANNKPLARLAALSILADQLGKGVALEPRPLDAKTAMAASRLFSPPGQPDSLISLKGNVREKESEQGARTRGLVSLAR